VIVVSDSSPLIALARVGQLHLLQILFGEVLVPGAVWDEVVQVDRPEVAEIQSAGWVTSNWPSSADSSPKSAPCWINS
jgi:predicted nucleic acid-binding protein